MDQNRGIQIAHPPRSYMLIIPTFLRPQVETNLDVRGFWCPLRPVSACAGSVLVPMLCWAFGVMVVREECVDGIDMPGSPVHCSAAMRLDVALSACVA